jgi:kynureninase
MTAPHFDETLAAARAMDAADPLAPMRDRFLIPPAPGGGDCVYLAGNSLGLQPGDARANILAELDDWARLGVEGHLHAKHAWLPYHELLTPSLARLVGALPHEVVAMNTLTVNLHLLMVSFYRPTASRFRILVEGGAFPSDQYAVASQARFHGFDPEDAVVELRPREGEETLRTEDVLATIDRLGDSIALVMLGTAIKLATLHLSR